MEVDLSVFLLRKCLHIHLAQSPVIFISDFDKSIIFRNLSLQTGAEVDGSSLLLFARNLNENVDSKKFVGDGSLGHVQSVIVSVAGADSYGFGWLDVAEIFINGRQKGLFRKEDFQVDDVEVNGD